ncbi:MAG: GIY-YIG nuclease family protein [Lachnospiraceae bacterium]|nr:GIY-YIG nuclease family protein [Lachnospiraceae bacterium]
MIGVYLITNKIDGKCYVGQSVDIERRFMEHKTPKATGNSKLHNDIQSLGVDNFEFTVIENCKKRRTIG